jgi:hypothetical protein
MSHSWKLYTDAVTEPDDNKLAARVQDANASIALRLNEVDSVEEFLELLQVSRAIEVLRIERLGA